MKHHKEYLFTPGPTHIPARVFEAMARPTLHHRTETFREIFRSALDGVRWLTGCPTDPIFLASSGTGAMEASLINTCKSGDTIIVVNAGKFGERFVKIGQRHGLNVAEIKAADGVSPPLDQIRAAVESNRAARAFCVQYCESSSAVLHPVPEIVQLVKSISPQMLTIVDAISAIGTLPIRMDELPIDIMLGASQKALMLPPGLAIMMLNDFAWKAVEQTERRSLYFDLLIERKNHAQDTTAWTPAMNIIIGLTESIAMLREEGLEQVFQRHAGAAAAARAGLSALGLELFGAAHPSPSVTAALTPNSVDAEALRKDLVAHYGIRIAGGQDSLKGKIIRIGHMGYTNFFDVLTALTGIEMTLRSRGLSLAPGVAAAGAILAWEQQCQPTT